MLSYTGKVSGSRSGSAPAGRQLNTIKMEETAKKNILFR
jgi:hypothetical protein